ncbi:unnamed protein product, partial [Rotaria sp. Silwood2]
DLQSIATTVTTTTTTIRREKVTFRQLQRQGRLLSVQLQHDCPSTKWFARFMRRHRLSLQKPKRNQKIPLSDVRCISNKRFATVILTIFGDDNTRVSPVLLFKGKGQVQDLEKSQYAKGVKVYFTPKAVNNRVTMDKYIKYWTSKFNDKNPKLFIADSSNTHLDEASIRLLRNNNIVVAVIPKGCTMYIQALDAYVFSIFKNHYYDCSEEYIEKAGGRSKIKLTASQSRILCTRLTLAAWNRTLDSIDFKKSFREIGYT